MAPDGRSRRTSLAILLFGAATAVCSAGERLVATEIEPIFKGMTLDGVYRNGEFFSETYREDGSIRYHGSDGADLGEWSVTSGRFCTFYEAAQGACFVVERDGANCFTFFADEGGDGPPRAAADWTSRGWDRSKPATCPKPPEAST